ncbi:GntR family transcriptional regulator [Roseiflexus sp.]|uniref:GntR family transcriptional regulator n=1 Tax=Roseiflexus sp. TaxID=2562120 RepID=UPI00398ADC64
MSDMPQRTMTEQVMTRLRDMILSGELAPGSRLDQNDLARQFGVSLVPLREALARLQSSGLVRIVPHRGVFVESLSVEELLDIYQVRESLEELAARLAAPRLSADDLTILDRLKTEMEQTAAVDDFDRFLDLHREFHFTIYHAAGRRHLLQLIAQLWDLSARYRRFQLYAFPDRVHTSLFETQAILDACHRRDPEALACMVRYKVHQTVVSLLDVMRREPTMTLLVNGKHANHQ